MKDAPTLYVVLNTNTGEFREASTSRSRAEGLVKLCNRGVLNRTPGIRYHIVEYVPKEATR